MADAPQAATQESLRRLGEAPPPPAAAFGAVKLAEARSASRGMKAERLFPSRGTTGIPSNWVPVRSLTGDYWVREPGAVVEDLRITDGDLMIDAPGVTIRRVEIRGGRIDNRPGSECHNGLVIEDTTVTRSTAPTLDTDQPAIGVGGYTARNVKIDNVAQGFRIGGASDGKCGPVTIEDSFARVVAPDICRDWHGDGIQGYDGPPLRVRNVTLELGTAIGCGGTAPFFYPSNQGNASVDIDGLLVSGGGYPFRLGMPGSVKDLNIVVKSWGYGPIDVKCSVVKIWDAAIVTLDANGQPGASYWQPCNTENGG
ncbi:hypothetical protein [Mesorhizobium sp. 1B3]|uniref:hypothetical protein n=1 Tax=Mesorhizobium sp. 1B3 TaxID=3243599 RepID=UPI003D983907